MEDKEKKPDDQSGEAAIDRGKKAIEADDKINKTDINKPEVKKDKEKDAEQWRNEG